MNGAKSTQSDLPQNYLIAVIGRRFDRLRSAMTRSLELGTGLSTADVKFLGDIQTHGWHVTGVFPTEGETGPNWAFSIGLFHSFCHPEVIVLHPKLDICMSLVNAIGQQVKTGKRYEATVAYSDILNDPYKCTFRLVQRSHYRNYLGSALWFYEDDPFPTLQCLWPDKAGKFPWDDGCNAFVKDSQPPLFAPLVK
jgi:hypothetical protein